MTRNKATGVGFIAVLLWSLLALFTAGSAPTPPLLLNTICFSIGGSLGLLWCATTGTLGSLRTIPLRVYAFGTAGLFGYHVLYFSALRLAPAAEAGLIAYLWPLLIVLFSGLLPGEQLKPGHLIGAAIGFSGAALIITGSSRGFESSAIPGYILAALCAIIWAGYSVFSRRLGDIPTASIAVFCVAAALLSGMLHLMLEETVWPAGTGGWIAVIGLGLGPVGLAFYVWDIGVKQGDIQLLGTASYAAPLLSTLFLVFAGIAAPSWVLAFAALLITAGAVIATRASINVKPSGGSDR